MKADRKTFFCALGLAASLVLNAVLVHHVVQDQNRVHELSTLVKSDVPDWLAKDHDTIDLYQRLNGYARSTASLYIELFCDGMTPAACEDKARSDAQRIGGKTWERYVDKQKADASMRTGTRP